MNGALTKTKRYIVHLYAHSTYNDLNSRYDLSFRAIYFSPLVPREGFVLG